MRNEKCALSIRNMLYRYTVYQSIKNIKNEKRKKAPQQLFFLNRSDLSEVEEAVPDGGVVGHVAPVRRQVVLLQLAALALAAPTVQANSGKQQHTSFWAEMMLVAVFRIRIRIQWSFGSGSVSNTDPGRLKSIFKISNTSKQHQSILNRSSTVGQR